MGCIYSKPMIARPSINNHDQLFALLCSPTKPTTTTTTDFWDLIPEINQETTESDPDDPVSAAGIFTRSKSYHQIIIKDNNQKGSRSFHTVEEYDALLARIHNFSLVQQHFQQDANQNQQESSLQQAGNFEKQETAAGWKRKAVGKGLKPLDVVSAALAIEFPDMISARSSQRLVHVEEEGTQIYSPTTPKFGSYNNNTRLNSKIQEKDVRGPVFSQQLLSAFEDCMQQLQDEEEAILRQMENQVEQVS